MLCFVDKLVDDLGVTETSNAAGYCVWNDWRARDQQAHIQRVYNHCRWRFIHNFYQQNNMLFL